MIGTFEGRTVRVTASTFLDAGGAAITDPDDVTITLTGPDGVTETGIVTESTGTWYAEFTPDERGRYVVRVTATKGGVTWEERDTVAVMDW